MEVQTPQYIYESPDGGKTVYRRILGSHHQELHYESPSITNMRSQVVEDQLWQDIRTAAQTNSALFHMLNEVKIYYNLIRENRNNDTF